jgi:hypothetical protein
MDMSTAIETKNIPLIVDGKDIVAEIVFKEAGAMVAIRSICNAIGVDPKGQQVKLNSDPRFTWGDISSRDSAGREQKMFCLPVDQIIPWLYTINSNKVKKGDVKENLLRFQLHLGKELNAVARGDVSIARTEVLEKQVKELIKQVSKLADLVFDQQTTINNFKKAASHNKKARELDSSAAGKSLAATKARKKAETLLN